MNELIETIRAGTIDGATPDQKRAAAAACRTLLTSLEARPGETLGLPILPSHPLATAPATQAPNPLAMLGQLDVDQVLDLVVAKLRARVPDAPVTASRYVPPPLKLPIGGGP